MPFYDYRCISCGKVFEVLHGMSAKPEGLRCEGCGAGDIQRVFYPVGTMRSGGESVGAHSHGGGGCSSCSSGGCGSCGH